MPPPSLESVSSLVKAAAPSTTEMVMPLGLTARLALPAASTNRLTDKNRVDGLALDAVTVMSAKKLLPDDRPVGSTVTMKLDGADPLAGLADSQFPVPKVLTEVVNGNPGVSLKIETTCSIPWVEPSVILKDSPPGLSRNRGSVPA